MQDWLSGGHLLRERAVRRPTWRIALGFACVDGGHHTWWYSCEPCEKLNRATLMPARSSSSKTSTLRDLGPRVHTTCGAKKCYLGALALTLTNSYFGGAARHKAGARARTLVLQMLLGVPASTVSSPKATIFAGVAGVERHVSCSRPWLILVDGIGLAYVRGEQRNARAAGTSAT